jgi:hypothetical protein
VAHCENLGNSKRIRAVRIHPPKFVHHRQQKIRIFRNDSPHRQSLSVLISLRPTPRKRIMLGLRRRIVKSHRLRKQASHTGSPGYAKSCAISAGQSVARLFVKNGTLAAEF